MDVRFGRLAAVFTCLVLLGSLSPLRAAAVSPQSFQQVPILVKVKAASAGSLAAYGGDLLAALAAAYPNAGQRPPVVMVHGWQGVNFDKPDCLPGDAAWADANWDHLDEDIQALGFYVGFAMLRSGSSFTEPDCTPLAEVNAPYVAEAIDQALAATGQPKVILVAHSMGGLVSRAYLESDLYRDDVVALYTLGTPHVGVPVEVLAELVELLTLGAVTLDDYCIAQPVVCQFSDNEAANPPGFIGIETFNNLHNPRAAGVAYHMVGGDIGFDHRGWLAEILYQLIPGPNDGIVPLPSAMGVSSADDGGGPPLPLLGPLAGPIDRLEVYAAHIEAFTDNPSVPLTCDYHYSYHGKDLWCTITGLDAYLDETFRSSSTYGCLEPTLNTRLADNTCGEVSDLGGGLGAAPEFAPRPAMHRAGPAQFGSLAAGQQAVHSVWLEAGPALLLAHGALDDPQGSLAVTLVSPSGQVLDAAYAAAHPEQVRYKGDGRAGLYLLADAEPGAWQVVVQALHAPAEGLRYRVAAAAGGEPFSAAADPQPEQARGVPLAASLPAAPPEAAAPSGVCLVDNPGPYLPGTPVTVTFTLSTWTWPNYVEKLDTFFADVPDAWAAQSLSAPPGPDQSGWNRPLVAQDCAGLVYWGIEDPFLGPLNDPCELSMTNLPLSGSFNGAWVAYEAYNAFPPESFEGSFPPANWQLYLLGGGSDNHGFQQTSARAHTGSFSAFHDDDNPWFWDPIETWLVMPSFTVAAGDSLVFWQNENNAGAYSYHGVWISTGSPNPSDGDYYELAALGPGTEDTWEQVRLGLSVFSGKQTYLAFKYEGDLSDEWYIDDVAIERLRAVPAQYTFQASFTVQADPALSCPGSPYVGVTSWYSDTLAGLAGLGMGDLVDFSADAITCDVSQACPLPTVALTHTVSLDGVCPGAALVEVPENIQAVTMCFELANQAEVTVTQHTLNDPALGGLVYSDTLALGPGESFAFQQDWDFGGTAGECFTSTAVLTSTTAPGFGQPQGLAADVQFITTTYTTQAQDTAGVCISDPLWVALELASLSAGEADGTLAFTVTLSAASLYTTTVELAFVDGSALAGQDYLSEPLTLTFAPGETAQSVAVVLLDDALVESSETFSIELHDPQNAWLGSPVTLVVSILDNDVAPPPVFWVWLPLVTANH